ncbi:MAG: hypothetical protein GX591_05295 [Planctomycetes bacterium]|nr:hypothetical protein [Planctomycetota bacterium]
MKESELAKELVKTGTYIKNHAGTLALSVVAAVAVLYLIVTLIGRADRARQIEWQHLYEAAWHEHQVPTDRLAALQELSEQSSQDAVAAWANVRAGELALQIVADGWYTLSEIERNARLQEARTAFETVLAEHGDNVQAAGKAHLGLGRLAEYQGNDDEAAARYAAAADLEPRGARLIAAEALERRARLAALPDSVPLATRPATQPAEDEAATQPAGEAATAPSEASTAPAEDEATQPAP